MGLNLLGIFVTIKTKLPTYEKFNKSLCFKLFNKIPMKNLISSMPANTILDTGDKGNCIDFEKLLIPKIERPQKPLEYILCTTFKRFALFEFLKLSRTLLN